MRLPLNSLSPSCDDDDDGRRSLKLPRRRRLRPRTRCPSCDDDTDGTVRTRSLLRVATTMVAQAEVQYICGGYRTGRRKALLLQVRESTGWWAQTLSFFYTILTSPVAQTFRSHSLL